MHLFGLIVMNVLILVNNERSLPSSRPPVRPPAGFLICISIPFTRPSPPSPLLLLLSTHLSADEEDEALISEETGDLSPRLTDEEEAREGRR